ncbi:MAG TPA: cytochrome c [Terriglobales bacterium]|nr:cytochrome c [Terriglobales bacterium]
MPARKFLWIMAALAACTFALMAQNQPQTAPSTQKVIKHVPIQPTSAASGQEMYVNYCASCHGKEGKGNGPAADALKVPPTDLTMLANKNGGKYPALKVSSVIRGEDVVASHGSRDMPIWGKLFWSISNGSDAEVLQRVANLNHYIESLQTK